MDTRSFIFLRGKLLYFFLGLCEYSEKLPKMFCHSCAVGNALQPQISVINAVSNLIDSGKAAKSVDNEKLLKKYFHRGYPHAALIICRSNYGSGCF